MSASSDGHYWNPDGYLLFGKANASITLPAKLEADTDVTVTTTTNARAILFAIRAE